MLGKILIIDDDRSVLQSLDLLIRGEAKEVTILEDPNRLFSMIRKGTYDAVLLDMNFSAGRSTGNEGIFWLKEILKLDPDQSVVMITAFGDIELAVKAMKCGAFDFIQKPWKVEKLIATIQAACQLSLSKRKVKELEKRKEALEEEVVRHYPEIIGRSEPVLRMAQAIRKVARTDTSVLVLGENGTGKELVAWEIHRNSPRKGQMFATVDLGSLHANLFESELFGHKKGAFTDARRDRTGRFEAAEGGTLFLDEIGNLPLHLQVKLLSVLQTHKVIPLGSNTPVPVNVRIISATNSNLEKLVARGLFREDLYYRINTVQIQVPALKDRERDMGLLAEHFLEQFAKKYKKNGLRLSKKAMDKLYRYHWPGNIRELQHVMENVVIMCESDTIQPANLHFSSSFPEEEASMNLQMMEKNTIGRALQKYRGNYSQIASELGISRTTLYHKIRKYDL